MDKLNDLTMFVRSAQTLSFSEAARQLGMSPSAVSKSIQRLEERLGVRLLNRTTRRLSLTQDGTAFFERSRQILEDIEEAELGLMRSQTTPTGVLRVDLSASLGRMHIIPALPRLLAQYPDLKVDVSLTNRMVDPIEEGLDAVVRVGTGRDNSSIVQPVAVAKFMVCAAPSYLQRYGTPETIADLKDHNCLAFISAWTGKSYDWQFQQEGETILQPVQGNLRLDSGEALLETAIAGAGIVQLYNYIAARAIADGKLESILENLAPPGLPISVVYPEKRHLSAKVRAFVEFVQELGTELKHKGIVA